MSAQAEAGSTNGNGEEGGGSFLKKRAVPIGLCLGVLVLIAGVVLYPLPPKPGPVLGETHVERVTVPNGILAWKDVGPVPHKDAPIVVTFEGLNLPSDYPKAVLASARWPELSEPAGGSSTPEEAKALEQERKNILADREHHDYSFATTVLETTRDSISVRVHRADGSSHAGWKPAVRVQVLVIP